jgi:hypothetical protein
MDDISLDDDLPPLTIDQMRDLAEAVREDFGGNLSRADFTASLLVLLEDVPGFESGDVRTSLIESAWAAYVVML